MAPPCARRSPSSSRASCSWPSPSPRSQALADVPPHGPTAAIAQACYAAWFYVAKTALPIGLAAVYPAPRCHRLARAPLPGRHRRHRRGHRRADPRPPTMARPARRLAGLPGDPGAQLGPGPHRRPARRRPLQLPRDPPLGRRRRRRPRPPRRARLAVAARRHRLGRIGRRGAGDPLLDELGPVPHLARFRGALGPRPGPRRRRQPPGPQ